MMKDALQQSRGGSFSGKPDVGNVDKELAASQTAYFSEDASDDVSIDDDDNVSDTFILGLPPLSSTTSVTTNFSPSHWQTIWLHPLPSTRIPAYLQVCQSSRQAA